MTETSYFWGGITTGDCGPYTADEFANLLRNLCQRDLTLEAPLKNYANELAITNPAGTTIRVATGAAIVDGALFVSDADVDLSVVAPGGGSNFYTVVVQKDFAAQEIRIDLLGPNAVAPPAVTQTAGTLWEVSIAEVEITSGSVITVTDVRVFCKMSLKIPADAFDEGAVKNDKLTADVVETNNIADSTIQIDKFDADANPLTNAGDIAVYDGADLQRLAVVADKILCSDAAGTDREYRQGMILIEEQLLSAAVATVTFSSLPTNLDHLIITVEAGSSRNAAYDLLLLHLNGDTASNYSFLKATFGDTLAVDGLYTTDTPQVALIPGLTAPVYATCICRILIPDFRLTTFKKGMLLQSFYEYTSNDSGLTVRKGYILWKDTSAITSIVLSMDGGSNFIAGSKFSLYGL